MTFAKGCLLATLTGLCIGAALAQVTPQGVQQNGELMRQYQDAQSASGATEGADRSQASGFSATRRSAAPAPLAIPSASGLDNAVPTLRSTQTISPPAPQAPAAQDVNSASRPQPLPFLVQSPPSPLLPGARATRPSGPVARPAQMQRPGLDPQSSVEIDRSEINRALMQGQRNEFQEFVAQSVGHYLPLFGYDLFAGVPSTFAPVDNIPVTPDYVVGPGDEILVRAWGQVDIDYRTTVDRNGVINLPRVGNINVTGIRYQDLNGFMRTAIGRVFRNFELSVTLGQLRSIQVFVVGQAQRPGSYTVSSLATLVSALFASGGPSPKGSMRSIQLKRGGRTITEFDLYDLLLKGDKSRDVHLLPGDVIYIPPTGKVAAISGSVSASAIFELKGRTSLNDLIELAGGLTTTADGRRVTVERIEERRLRKVEEFTLDAVGREREIRDGDMARVYVLSPKFDNAITLRGAVANPGRYPWREGMRVRDIIPSTDALIVPDYWARQTRASDVLVAGQQRLRTEVTRSYDEINWDYAVIERLDHGGLTPELIPFNLGRAVQDGDATSNVLLRPGDTLTIFSRADIQVPIAKQTKYVRLEGEVATPGIYQIIPGETLQQLVSRVGGITRNAYLYGSVFTRESTREFQQRRLDEAVSFLESEIQRSGAIAAGSAAPGEAESIRLRTEGQQKLAERLRLMKASGRIVLELRADSMKIADLPALTLEDGDSFVVPPEPSTVSVIGSVYNQNAFLYRPDNRVGEYLTRAGGPTRTADVGSTFLIRADGSVESRRQSGTFGNFEGSRLTPGDTVVVPEELDRFRFTKELKDWTQIFSQFALGVAGLKVLKGF